MRYDAVQYTYFRYSRHQVSTTYYLGLASHQPSWEQRQTECQRIVRYPGRPSLLWREGSLTSLANITENKVNALGRAHFDNKGFTALVRTQAIGWFICPHKTPRPSLRFSNHSEPILLIITGHSCVTHNVVNPERRCNTELHALLMQYSYSRSIAHNAEQEISTAFV